jgi:hypothetical protein
MNTRIFSKLLMAALILFSFGSCQKDVYEIYDVNEIEVLPINAQKTKAKRDAQYISILYTNYFQEAIGPSKLLQALDAIRSVGDKQIASDMIVSKYLTNAPIIPSKAEMDADPEAFIRNTYLRFYTRQPIEAELSWMLNFLKKNPTITPEHVYLSFSTSNEYYYY